MPDEHWSLPGAQEKFTLTRLRGRWYEPHGAAPSTHIVKPGVARLAHQATLEHATMRVAAHLGLTVAHTELLAFDNEPAIVVQRFDRYFVGDTVHRFHQVDFCQAMGRPPANKYEEHNGPTTDALALMLRSQSSRPDTDIRRFSDAVLFNYVAGAPDGHSKNFALVYNDDGTARMAPLYDLSTALAYDVRAGGYDLGAAALSIGGRRKFGQVLKRHVQRHAERVGLDPDERVARAHEYATTIVDAYTSALDQIDTPAARELEHRLLPRLTNHANDFAARLA